VTAAALLGVALAWLVAPREDSAAGDLPRVVTAGPNASGSHPGRARPREPARAQVQRGRPVPVVRARPAGIDRATPPPRGASPSRLSIPSIGVSLPVLPVGVDPAGLMALPDTAYAAGWYRFGRGPLDPSGATVIAGHVDTRAEGVGPLARLASLRAGAAVEVRAGGRTVTYRVVRVERIARTVLDLPHLFARAGAARLHLVTCGGDYRPDRGGYQDNVVVTARPIR
jgi:LPXTG-site transpeptidase (sortase) family protein